MSMPQAFGQRTLSLAEVRRRIGDLELSQQLISVDDHARRPAKPESRLGLVGLLGIGQ